MSNSKTSKGFANVSIKVCKYIIMAVIIIVCATVAYNFGTKIFYSAGVEAKPGTDMTVTIKKGTNWFLLECRQTIVLHKTVRWLAKNDFYFFVI